MDINSTLEDAEMEKMMQNMSVDDFVSLMLTLTEEQAEEDDDFCVDPMGDYQAVSFRVVA